MILAAKVALAFTGTIAAAGAYTLHDGIAQVQVDDNSGTHVHIWAPAAIVPMAMHVIPARELHKFPHQVTFVDGWQDPREEFAQLGRIERTP